MRDGPEKEKNGETAGHRAHDVYCIGRVVTPKQNNEETSQQDKQRCARRVGKLQLVRTGNKFTGILEASGGFGRKNVNKAGHDANDPSGNVIRLPETHTCRGWFFTKQGKNREGAKLTGKESGKS